VIRNAGGVATDDAIRSLVISQRLLGTREIILIHHTDCGMLPRFKGSPQRCRVGRSVGGYRGPLRGFSIRGSCGGGC
jgi:hypothetical protein